MDPAQIRLLLLALSHVVSRLERTHVALVEAIVNMPWMTLDNATVKSYTVFIGMLLSARPEYLSLVLAKIAQGFTHQSGIQALDSSQPSTSSEPLTRRTVYDRIHYLLQHLLALIPTLPSTLQPLLVRHFPHKRQNQSAQTTYIRNLLRISQYCPEISDRILATIVDRTIQIDVEIQIELEELEEEETLDDHDVFELDPFDTVVGQDASSDSDSSSDEGDDAFSDISSEAEDYGEYNNKVEIPTNVKQIQDMVKKLDAILSLLFEHFEATQASCTGPQGMKAKIQEELPPLPPLEFAGITSPMTPLYGSPFLPTPHPNPFASLPIPLSDAASIINRADLPVTPQSKRRNNRSALRNQFYCLLGIFDRTILRTFKSRYTQFLLFWYAGIDAEFADIFQGLLVDRALTSVSEVPQTPLVTAPPTTQDTSPSRPQTPSNAMPTRTPSVTRAAAASYIGSLISRANFVDREGSRRVVAVLCDYLRAHLDGVDEALKSGLAQFGDEAVSSSAATNAVVSSILSSGQHAVFFALTQAVLLIFCFRWRDLLFSEDGAVPGLSIAGKPGEQGQGRWMPELVTLKRAVSSILNPLKVCSANVVMQFARVAQSVDFMYCYTIVDANKRSDVAQSLPTAQTQTNAPREASLKTATSQLLNPTVLFQSTTAELNTFFPFDPYRLPKSKSYIQGMYREWSSVAIDDDGSDEDSDEDGEQDQLQADSDDGYKAAKNISASLTIPKKRRVDKQEEEASEEEGLGHSFDAMSISPVRL